MKQHKIGIIVYGIVGKRKREYIDLNPYFQTHYVKDVNFDGEGNFSDGVYYFKDYREIFDHELDIVFVSWLLLYLRGDSVNCCVLFLHKRPAKRRLLQMAVDESRIESYYCQYSAITI